MCLCRSVFHIIYSYAPWRSELFHLSLALPKCQTTPFGLVEKIWQFPDPNRIRKANPKAFWVSDISSANFTKPSAKISMDHQKNMSNCTWLLVFKLFPGKGICWPRGGKNISIIENLHSTHHISIPTFATFWNLKAIFGKMEVPQHGRWSWGELVLPFYDSICENSKW